MKIRKLKQLLEVFRPGGGDVKEPAFAEALRQVEGDPRLTQWFTDQRRFDRIIAGSLKALTVPADLKESILANRKVVVVQPVRWTNWRFSAAAAFLILAAIAAGTLATRKTTPFSEFRTALVDKAWAGDSHLDFESSDIDRVRQWFARQFVNTNFKLPDGLRQASVIGGSVVEADGYRVPMVCLADGTRHLHLFVVEGRPFSELPAEGGPDFEKCAQWKTAAWRDGGKTYVLTGMNYQTFVSRFRKSGRWTTSG